MLCLISVEETPFVFQKKKKKLKNTETQKQLGLQEIQRDTSSYIMQDKFKSPVI